MHGKVLLWTGWLRGVATPRHPQTRTRQHSAIGRSGDYMATVTHTDEFGNAAGHLHVHVKISVTADAGR